MKLKQIRVLLSAAVIISAVVGCSKLNARDISPDNGFNPQWHNSLAPHGDDTFGLVLTKNGSPACRILLSADAGSIDTKAAELLKQALDAGTGSEFEVVRENDYTGGPVISLGETDLYKKSGLKPSIDLDEDGYSIAQKDGSLFLIGGRRRGSISPAIALIEEDMGGRLYSRQEGLRMPPLQAEQIVVLREYVPLFKVRTMFQWESFDAEFQLFNRVGSFTSSYDKVPEKWGGSTKLPAKFFVHTFATLLPNELYFDEHPEYFALIDGKRKPQGHGGGAQFCLTNPDARRIVKDRVLEELKTYHSYGLFDVSPNDTSHGFCQCPNCMAIEKREGSAAGPLLDFVNYVADAVAKVYPNVKITTLAYIDTNKPPKHIRPHKNVAIRLANDTASFPYPMFYLEESDVFFPNMKNWIKLGAQLLIWDYVVDYKAWPMPRPNLEVIDHNINTYAKYGIYGLFLQSSHYGVGENQGKLRAWVYSKKMWDPSRKMDDLVRDFNYGYFGKAADLMQSYNDLLYAEWKNFHDNHTYKDSAEYPNKFCFTDEYYPKARAIFEKALKLTEDTPDIHSKVELEYVSILFYRLQMMPPTDDPADRASYKADLEKFVELTDRYHVDWVNEGVTKTPQRVQEWRRKYNIKSDTPEVPVTLRLTPDDITRCADGAVRMDDISAPGGTCIRLPIQGDGWSLQWFFGSSLLPDVDYSVRVQIRADKKKATGPAVNYGIYAINIKKIPLSGTIDASDISDSGYGWVDCGTVNGSDAPSSYFYFAQIPNSSVKFVYISSVEIIPKVDKTK